MSRITHERIRAGHRRGAVNARAALPGRLLGLAAIVWLVFAGFCVAHTAAAGATSTTVLHTTDSIKGTGTSGRSYKLNAAFRTPDGYSFKVASLARMGMPRRGDSSELQPGQDALLLPVAGTEIVKNTTPGGRDYSGNPGDGASLVALYKSPSPICPVPPDGPGDATYIDLNQDVYCIVDLVAFQQSTTTLKIAAGHSVTLAPTPSTCQDLDYITGGCGEVPTPADDTSFNYLASHVHSVLAALARPPDLVVLLSASTSSNDIPAGTCQPADTGGWIIASSQRIRSCS
jgi:hypothetical protein